jgi:hypothetical protein
MNNIALAAVAAAVLATPLAASGQTQAAAPTSAPAASASAALAAAPQPATKPAKRLTHHVPSKADARNCLEFPNNMQIIKCAEKYRYASASQ